MLAHAMLTAVRTWLLDLDGVVWLDRDPIPGSADAVAELRRRGVRVVFVTNNSGVTRAAHLAALAAAGIRAEPDELLLSADAVASLVRPGERVLLSAGDGAREALTERGVEVVESGEADAVVVGLRRDFDYERLTVLVRAVRAGARLIGTNDDATYPTPDGVVPGGGALLAAVAYASGAVPVVAGKPHAPMVDLVRARIGAVEVVVGDRDDTDGALARRLGARFALVLSGVTRPDQAPGDPAPDFTTADLAALVAAVPA